MISQDVIPDLRQTEPDLFLFMASAVHDMKNSLVLMRHTVETLLKDAQRQSDPAYPQISNMLFETDRLNLKLIQMLALYKKVGTRAYPFDPQTHSAHDFAMIVAAQSQLLIQSRQIRFDVDVAADLIWVFDEDIVFGVVNHAVNNAIRYTKDRIGLSIKEVDGMLEIRVEDNGSGFPADMLEAPQAIRNGVDFATGSTGLGLYFSHQAAIMHRHAGRCGKIALENNDRDGGGVFMLHLP